MNVEYLEIGRVCVSRAGHDKNSLYMVFQIVDEKYVMLVDGTKRTTDNPKKKKVRHIKYIPFLLENQAKRIMDGKSVHDFEIAKALEEVRTTISIKGKEG